MKPIEASKLARCEGNISPEVLEELEQLGYTERP